MTTQLFNAELVDLLRSTFPDRQHYAKFQYNVAAQFYDFPLVNEVEGNHFNDNDSSYPAGWTEADAPASTNTNSKYGFWFIAGNSSNLEWKYRKQSTYNVEADTPDATWVTLQWGPIFYRDTQSTTDETYYFGFYADNAGSINEDKFIRTALNWDSSGGVWRVRGERKDGTTQTNGSWFDLSQQPLIQPLYLRTSFLHRTGGTGEFQRAYLGGSNTAISHTLLMSASANETWGQYWMQIHNSRGASGISNYLYIGAVDQNNEP